MDIVYCIECNQAGKLQRCTYRNGAWICPIHHDRCHITGDPHKIEQHQAREALRYLQAATTCRDQHNGRMERIFVEAAQRSLEGRLNDLGRKWADAVALTELVDGPRLDADEVERYRRDHPPYDHQESI